MEIALKKNEAGKSEVVVGGVVMLIKKIRGNSTKKVTFEST